MKTLIVCASKYGSTMQIGRWIAERLSYEGFVVDILKAGETHISLRLTKDDENTSRPNPLSQGKRENIGERLTQVEREPNNPASLMGGGKGEGEINAFSEQEITIDGYDLIIMGSGIYSHYVLPELRDFMEKNKDVLKEKRLALFGVAMKTTPVFYKGKIHGGIEHLKPLINMFGDAVIHADMLHGEMVPQKMDEKDREGLVRFYKMLQFDEEEIKRRMSPRTLMDKKECWEFAETLLKNLNLEAKHESNVKG